MSGYGKHFESMYTGSMRGAGPDVFAVWGYAFSHARNGTVELNPDVVAFFIGMSAARAQRAIEFLCQPDARSRTKDEDGRRLIREGEFLYRVVTHRKYRDLGGSSAGPEAERKRRQREAVAMSSRDNLDNKGQHGTPASASVSDSVSSSSALTVSDAFAAGWDARAVARLFGDERKRAGKGARYALTMKHFDAGQSALEWSLAEGETVDAAREAVRASVRAFLAHSNNFTAEAGYTFPHWASDPGKWLATEKPKSAPGQAVYREWRPE